MEIKEKTLQLLEDMQNDDIEAVYKFSEKLYKESLVSKSRPKNYIHAQKITNKFSGSLSDVLLKERYEV